MEVWLTRDKTDSGTYSIFTGPTPCWDGEEWTRAPERNSVFLKCMCPREFHRFCKIRLRKGRCVPVKVTHLKNGFKFEVKKKE